MGREQNLQAGAHVVRRKSPNQKTSGQRAQAEVEAAARRCMVHDICKRKPAHRFMGLLQSRSRQRAPNFAGIAKMRFIINLQSIG